MESKMKEHVNSLIDRIDYKRIDSALEEMGVSPSSLDGLSTLMTLALACGFNLGGEANV